MSELWTSTGFPYPCCLAWVASLQVASGGIPLSQLIPRQERSVHVEARAPLEGAIRALPFPSLPLLSPALPWLHSRSPRHLHSQSWPAWALLHLQHSWGGEGPLLQEEGEANCWPKQKGSCLPICSFARNKPSRPARSTKKGNTLLRCHTW